MREKGGREIEGKGTGTKEHRPSAAGPICDVPEPRWGAQCRCQLKASTRGIMAECVFYMIGGRYMEGVDTERHA